MLPMTRYYSQSHGSWKFTHTDCSVYMHEHVQDYMQAGLYRCMFGLTLLCLVLMCSVFPVKIKYTVPQVLSCYIPSMTFRCYPQTGVSWLNYLVIPVIQSACLSVRIIYSLYMHMLDLSDCTEPVLQVCVYDTVFIEQYQYAHTTSRAHNTV